MQGVKGDRRVGECERLFRTHILCLCVLGRGKVEGGERRREHRREKKSTLKYKSPTVFQNTDNRAAYRKILI